MSGAPATTESHGMRVLPREECLKLLERPGVGILALRGVEAPALRPVNFAARDERVVIRTGEGRILAAAEANEPASFVVTAVDAFEHTGRSVVVTGRLETRVPDEAIESLPVRPWVRSPKHHVVTLSMDEVSGREIDPTRELG